MKCSLPLWECALLLIVHTMTGQAFSGGSGRWSASGWNQEVIRLLFIHLIGYAHMFSHVIYCKRSTMKGGRLLPCSLLTESGGSLPDSTLCWRRRWPMSSFEMLIIVFYGYWIDNRCIKKLTAHALPSMTVNFKT